MDYSNMREYLLKHNMINEYQDILSYFQNPYGSISDIARKALCDLGYCDFEKTIAFWKKDDPKSYREEILYGQAIIWQEILNAFKSMSQVKEIIEQLHLVFYQDNYLKACQEVIRILDIYSNAKAAVTILENHLGVDRYLDRIAQKDFLFIIETFDSIHKEVEELLENYKLLFLEKWNTTKVSDIVLHKMIRNNMDNQVCSLLQGNKKKTILFILDGLGLGQFLWSQKIVPQNRNMAYSNNIFEWLKNENCIDIYTLAAPLITDTAAGLSQIFTGATSKETRIFSSTVKKENFGGPVSIKTIASDEFRRIIDISNNSFTVDIASQKDYMNIYYCSKYNSENVSGFSKYLFDGANVRSITPPERVYSFLLDDLNDKRSEGTTVVYITSIDNSGHVMGSFSQFERYEHEKINSLFRNFLIELANNNSEIFDGNTSILITADHGMTESYRINVSRDDIKTILSPLRANPRIIESNRAEFIYGIKTEDIPRAKSLLANAFEEKEIDSIILSKEDLLYQEYIPCPKPEYEDAAPDIIILLISEGIFYSRNISENLMHFGGHGGHSIDEVFVPLINIELDSHLLDCIRKRYLSLL